MYIEGDIPVMQSGGNSGAFWGSEGLWAVIILAIIFGWGGNGLFGGNNSAGTTAIDASLARGFNQAEVLDRLDVIGAGVNNGFATTNLAISNSTANINSAIQALGAQMAQCCCSIERNIDGVRYDMANGFANVNYNLASQFCDLKNAVTLYTRDIVQANRENTDRILQFLVESKITKLTEDLAQARGELSQQKQTTEIVNSLKTPTPIPAYVVQSPYVSACYPCGACAGVVQ